MKFILKKTDIPSLLKTATEFLNEKKIKNAKISAEILLSHILKIKRSDLFLNFDKTLVEDDIKKYEHFIKRRAKKEPIEYITGKVDFYGCEILVDKNVLIPRVETEILVDLICKKLEKDNLDGKILIDLCTGSGVVAIALKKRFPRLKVMGGDISKKAFNIAKKNAKLNNVNAFFELGDLLKPFKNVKADFIVSNPPYVSEIEYLALDEDVKNFEPKKALIAKDGGLEFYKKIEKQIFTYVNPKAKLFFEIGYLQKKEVLNIFSDKKYVLKQVIKDFSKKDRFFFVEIE
ncbi:MAG: Release factor glutamine methyltransferase [Candidatus Anoxychlamydiales bacterium]|nr:Release factor glutamine methyltransferase [Candidatus Anoxychlamydiales bacterium]